jgi:hypothetical protein
MPGPISPDACVVHMRIDIPAADGTDDAEAPPALVAPAGKRLDLADVTQVGILCAQAGCDVHAVYVAVACVGDALDEVRRYLRRTPRRRPVLVGARQAEAHGLARL